jgi:MerR family redox-sensitive transcriptional activator SoxR
LERGVRTTDLLTIGELSARTGLSVSAIRFYEAKGLVAPLRNSGGQRRFPRSDIRRLSFVLIAQQLGFSIEDIRGQLGRLPQGRTPTAADWSSISRDFKRVLDERIDAMTRMRDRLDGCIGCGCLSLKTCALYNPGDRVRARGPGPRFLLDGGPRDRMK